MKKVFYKVVDFFKRLFNKSKYHAWHVRVSDEESLRNCLSFDDIEITLDDDIILSDILKIDGCRVKINGNGHTIWSPDREGGIGYPIDLCSVWIEAQGRVEIRQADGSFITATEKPKGGEIYRLKIDFKDDYLTLYTHITFSVGWTTYTYPITSIADGYVYMKAFVADYNPDYDFVRYGYNCRYRLMQCRKKGILDYAITICDGVDVTIDNLKIYGGINIGDSTLRLKKCKISQAGKHGVMAMNANVYIDHCQFDSTWRSAVYCRGGYVEVYNSNFTNCVESLENYGCIQSSGEYDIQDNTLDTFGSFGIRVGCGLKRLMESYVCENVENNVLNNTMQQGVVTDTGAIYVAPNNNNCIIKDNIINGYNGKNQNHGIYLDDGAYNVNVEENQIEVSTGYAISARYAYVESRGYDKSLCGANRRIVGNVCKGGGIWFRASEDDDKNGCVYDQNIVIGKSNYESTNKLK